MAIPFSLKSISPKFLSLIEKRCILTSKKSQYSEAQKMYCYEVDHKSGTVWLPVGAWREFCDEFPWTKEDYPSTSVKFLGKLLTPETDKEKGYRDQTEVSKQIMSKLEKDHSAFLAAATGFGKCFHPEQKLVMVDKSLKAAKDIVVGDLLLGDDWLPREVTSTVTGEDEMYEVYIGSPENQAPALRCNGAHILCLRPFAPGDRDVVELSVDEYLKLSEAGRNALGLYGMPISDLRRTASHPEALTLGSMLFPLTQKELTEWTAMNFQVYARAFFMKVSHETTSFSTLGHSPDQLSSFLEAARRGGILVTQSPGLFHVHPLGLHYFSIKSVGRGPYAGFTVSGTNRRFFLDNGLVTHNTTIGCEIACKSKMKVAVLCFFEIVRKQWVKALQTKTSGKVQKVTKNTLDPTADFYVIGVNKASNIPREELQNIGLVLVDEAHVTAKETFENALLRFAPWGVVGLSATPRRPDGLHSALELNFGSKKEFIIRRETKPFKVYKVETNFIPDIRERPGGPKGKTLDWGLVINSLANSVERQKFIVDRMVETLQDPKEYLLVLTLRIDEGVAIANLLREALAEGRWSLGEGDQPVIQVFGKQKGEVTRGVLPEGELEKSNITKLRKLAGLNGISHEGVDKLTLKKKIAKVFQSPKGGFFQDVRGGIKGVDRDGVLRSWTSIPPEAGFYRVQIVGMKKGGIGYDDPTRTSEYLLDSVTDVEQYEGRVRMVNCSIYDIVDDFSVNENHWRKREKHFLKRGAEIIVEQSPEPRTCRNKRRDIFIPERFG